MKSQTVRRLAGLLTSLAAFALAVGAMPTGWRW